MSILQRLAEIENSIKKLNDKVTAVSAVNEVDTSKRNDLQQNGNKKRLPQRGPRKHGGNPNEIIKVCNGHFEKGGAGDCTRGGCEFKKSRYCPLHYKYGNAAYRCLGNKCPWDRVKQLNVAGD